MFCFARCSAKRFVRHTNRQRSTGRLCQRQLGYLRGHDHCHRHATRQLYRFCYDAQWRDIRNGLCEQFPCCTPIQCFFQHLYQLRQYSWFRCLRRRQLALNDSIILMVSTDVISQFNINTGTITVLANIPGINGFGEMFEHNGQIYLTHAGCGNYPDGVYILDLNPVTLTPVTLPSAGGGIEGPLTSVCNQIIGMGYEIGEYNINNGTVNPLCDFTPPGIGSGFQSTAPNPLDDDGPLCNCTTESGNWLPPNGVLNVCGTQSITVNHVGDEFLDGDDNLVFILSTGFNPSSEPNNILGVFPTSSIPFIPGVTQFGEYYRVYAVAGDAVGAGVDYTDPCLEISPAKVVRWLELPSVTFTSPPGNCGGCQTLNVQLEGEAPFTLTYQTLIGGNVQGNFTQVFNSFTGTLQVCPPLGYTGPFEVVATQLLDDACVCGQ